MGNMDNVFFKHVQILSRKCICGKFVPVTDGSREKRKFIIIGVKVKSNLILVDPDLLRRVNRQSMLQIGKFGSLVVLTCSDMFQSFDWGCYQVVGSKLVH